MRVVQINATCGIGSTGKICIGISQILTMNNINNYILSNNSDGYRYGIICSSNKYIKFQALKSKIFGNCGFNSKKATKKIIAEIERIKPDIVHLHNIHGHDCNIEMLFTYFRENKTKLIWTFHDCWAFTGYCAHFTMVKCNKWQSNCNECIQKNYYTWFLDKSGFLYKMKKKLFANLDLTIVTPSRWLYDMVKLSFLKDYQVNVIHNGIDLSVFKPIQSDFRQKYGLINKKIILGISFGWDERKGLDVFIELSQRLSNEYRLVLIGTDKKIDKQLPNNIISIHRTQNQQELVKVYSAADVFVNPTREETYPTVNMEALACGTPVLTFNTGGSPEIIDDKCGSVVECDNINDLEKEIVRICTENPYSIQDCIDRAKNFDKNERFKEYLALYNKLI